MNNITCLIVIDEFQFALNKKNIIQEKNIEHFINSLLFSQFTSRIILTSRYHPRLDEKFKGLYYAREIKGLSNIEGKDLLRYLNLMADGKTLGKICRSVNGHPLALKIFTVLTERIPVEEVLRGDFFGRKCSEKLLAKVFDTVLSEDEQHLMVDASVYRRPVPYNGLQIFNTSFDEIEGLSNKFLFEYDKERQLYSQHPIVNNFAYCKLKAKGQKYLTRCHSNAANYYEKKLKKKYDKATLEVVEHYLERHHHYRQTGDLQKTIETAIDSFDELSILAKELYKRKQFEVAELAYQAVLELDEMDAKANFYYAVLQDRRNVEFSIVEHYFKEALKRHSNPYYICTYGQFLASRRKTKEARSCFERRLYKFYKYKSLYQEYAKFEIKNKRKDKAIEIYIRGISAFPKSGTFYVKCAELLLERGETLHIQKAIELYDKGLKENLEMEEIYLAYGGLLQKLGEDEKAKQIYEKGLKAKPDGAGIYLAYGTLLQKLGEDGKAKQNYEEGLKAKPDGAGIYLAYGTLLKKLGEYEQAKKIYNQVDKLILTSDPCFLAYYCSVVFDIKWSEKYNEVEILLQKALKEHPESSSANIHYGCLKANLNDTKTAEKFFNKGIEISPTCFGFYKYAEFLQKQNRIEEAKEISEKGLQLNPENDQLIGLQKELETEMDSSKEIEKMVDEEKNINSESLIQNDDNHITKQPIHQNGRKGKKHPGIDVLIITALKDELNELLKCQGTSFQWQLNEDQLGFPYYTQTFTNKNETSFTAAAARPVEIGGLST